MRKCLKREAAKAAGEPVYSTGKPCKDGHNERSTATGACLRCMRTHGQRHYAKKIDNPERAAARAAGLRHYSGRPCVHGHDLRFVSNNHCVECDRGVVRRYHAKRPGLGAKWARDHRKKSPEGHRKSSQRWWRANHERANETLKRWKAANPERVRELGRIGMNNRRAKLAANGGRFTADDITALFEKQNGHCAACPSEARLEIDHILPVFLGGSSDPTNLQLLCLPCNRAKGRKHPDEWRAAS